MLLLLLACKGAFSPTLSQLLSTPGSKGRIKPKNVTWAHFCGYDQWKSDEGLTERQLKLAEASGRDTVYLRTSSDIIDALDGAVPRHAPGVWNRRNSVLDVGAGSGEISRYLSRRHDGLLVKAYDVLPPANNSFARFRQMADAWPVHLFDGSSIPEPDASHDLVMFIMSLHHAARAAPALLMEAARVSRRWVLIIDHFDRLSEPDAERRLSKAQLRAAVEARAVTFACMRDPKAIFRSKSEWAQLLERTGTMRVRAAGPLLALSNPLSDWLQANTGGGLPPAAEGADDVELAHPSAAFMLAERL